MGPCWTPIGGSNTAPKHTPNITLLPPPPKCPELNPTENIWEFMRDNWLSNRVHRLARLGSWVLESLIGDP
jgi:transposase